MKTLKKLLAGVAAATMAVALIAAPNLAEAKKVKIRVQSVIPAKADEVVMLKDFADNVRALTDRAAAADLRATAAGLTGWALLMLFSDMTARFSTMVLFFASMGLGLGIVLTHRAGPRAVYRLVHYRHRL